jgi:hypothetical protein
MKNLDIDIYMSSFKGFFERNPDQLRKLIGNAKPEKFFDGIRNIVETNSKDEEKPLEPTKQQIIELVLKLNSPKKIPTYFNHHMGDICLN